MSRVITERHISGFSHANFQKVVGGHSDAVTVWKDSVKKGLVGSPVEGNHERRAEIHWVVTVGVNTGVFNSRRKALTAIGGRNEAFAYLTAFYDINAANAYFVEEYMEGHITILA
ncbi:hypothetical protein F5887DRAFT_1075282 [Amanita rubescens]|nr:hypothetical protein F5887DRAFT_1075282 [Amanita rubescens]